MCRAGFFFAFRFAVDVVEVVRCRRFAGPEKIDSSMVFGLFLVVEYYFPSPPPSPIPPPLLPPSRHSLRGHRTCVLSRLLTALACWGKALHLVVRRVFRSCTSAPYPTPRPPRCSSPYLERMLTPPSCGKPENLLVVPSGKW